jgi:hypothetical protein
MAGGKWYDVYLFEKKQNAGQKGTVVLANPPANEKKLEYTIHYTLEEYRDGFFRTLDYEGSTLVQTYPCTLEIPVGPCLLVSGNRLTNGTVLTKLRVFEVKGGETISQPIEIRKNLLPLPEYGRINMELFDKSIQGRMVIAWVDPDREPTKHLLADLRQKKGDFEKKKDRIIMVFPSEEQMKSFVKTETALLPKNISYSFQSTFPVRPSDIKLKTGGLKNLPVVICFNEKGVINYLSEGYRIGIGDELLTLMQ